MRYKTYGLTDIGTFRETNEDSIMIGESICSNGIIDTDMAPPFIAAVCDGVGGENSGELASKMTLEELLITEFSKPSDLKTTIFNAHDKLVAYGMEHGESFNMQTTICCVFFDSEDNVFCLNVGDSRAYLYTGGKLCQVSTDQSLNQFLDDTGRSKIFSHDKEKLKHVIISSLGNVRQYPMIDFCKVSRKLADGDVLMLCSDGVTDYLSDDEVVMALSAPIDLDKKAQALLERSIERGSRDNISVILIELKGE